MDEEGFRKYNTFRLLKTEGQVNEIDFHFFHLVDLIFFFIYILRPIFG